MSDEESGSDGDDFNVYINEDMDGAVLSDESNQEFVQFTDEEEIVESVIAGGRGDAVVSGDQFDISLPPEHSYLPQNMVEVQGRCVLQPGWAGQLPCIGHHSIIYPGETIPMVISFPADCDMIHTAIAGNALFGLLFPSQLEANSPASGYGVLCEVFEATETHPIALKAKVRQRFRCKYTPGKNTADDRLDFQRIKLIDVIILPEVFLGNMLANSRLAGLDRLRNTSRKDVRERINKMDIAVTNWSQVSVQSCNVERLTKIIQEYFSNLNYLTLPTDVISLSFWAASNLPLSYEDRLQIFKEDNALQRLRIEAIFVDKLNRYVMCCKRCGQQALTEIAREEDAFAMSTEGLKSNYCNLGGYVHDIMTMARVSNVRPSGRPSEEYSWFPGYMWTIIVCSKCHTHVGWRFHSSKQSVRPQMFYALCRNNVFPYSPCKGVAV